MARPTPQEAAYRIAQVKARLRHVTPIWRSQTGTRALYASNDGYYLVWDTARAAATVFVGISPSGEIKDLSGYDADNGDMETAASSLRSAGLTVMSELVIATWQHR